MEEIKKVYFDLKHPAGLGGYSKLRAHLGKHIKNNEIKTFLSSQDAYTLHYPRTRMFKRDFVFVTNIDEEWQIDLADLSKYSKDNNGVCYLLCVIDVLSKFAWVRCLKNKKAETVALAFQDILNVSKRKCITACFDKGKEFLGKKFQSFLERNEIKWFCNENSEIKSCICERFIRTLKEKIWKYFTYSETNKYVNVLQDIVCSYNSSKHRSIKVAPCEVNDMNFMTAWQNLYGDKLNLPGAIPRFKKFDYVRISKLSNVFKKGFEGKWSTEIFKVVNVLLRRPTMYELCDLNGEKIKGRFYEKEIQKVSLPLYHKIDKIISKRGHGIRTEYLVSWKGYSSDFNSWVKASDFKKQK